MNTNIIENLSSDHLYYIFSLVEEQDIANLCLINKKISSVVGKFVIDFTVASEDEMLKKIKDAVSLWPPHQNRRIEFSYFQRPQPHVTFTATCHIISESSLEIIQKFYMRGRFWPSFAYNNEYQSLAGTKYSLSYFDNKEYPSFIITQDQFNQVSVQFQKLLRALNEVHKDSGCDTPLSCLANGEEGVYCNKFVENAKEFIPRYLGELHPNIMSEVGKKIQAINYDNFNTHNLLSALAETFPENLKAALNRTYQYDIQLETGENGKFDALFQEITILHT